MKREIPLIILDKSRLHKLGEKDFIVCTDKDNGFIAEVSYMEHVQEDTTDTYIVRDGNGGISVKIEIKRFIGSNKDNAKIKSLLKMAVNTLLKSNVKTKGKEISTEDCINFAELLLQSYKTEENAIKGDYEAKQTLVTMRQYMTAIKEKLQKI